MYISEFNNIDKYLQDKDSRIIHQVWFGTIPNKKMLERHIKNSIVGK